jgi:two-component system OmpR family response regulator
VHSPSHTVLVVDDDPSIRLLCRINLELDGWSVREAAGVDEARAQAGAADVVVLDLHIGTGSGADLLRELRRDHPHLKVAMLTGSDRLDGVDSDAVITKPFTIAELTATVASLAPDAG